MESNAAVVRARLPRTSVPGAGSIRSLIIPSQRWRLATDTVMGVDQVVQMNYGVRWQDDVTVAEGAPSLAVDLAGFECRLDGDALTAKPRSQYSTVEDARKVLDPALHAWEAHCELDLGHRFSFTYSGCTIGDPPKQSAMTISDLIVMTDHIHVSKVLGEFHRPIRPSSRKATLPTSYGCAGERSAMAVSAY